MLHVMRRTAANRSFRVELLLLLLQHGCQEFFAQFCAAVLKMLKIGDNRVSYSAMAYLAFRVAFRDTLEGALQKQISGDVPTSSGYLTKIPFLQSVAARVQLDVLAETWHRVISGLADHCSLVDESVLYAVCESAAHLAEEQPDELNRLLQDGPLQMHVDPDQWLATRLRAMHLSLPIAGDFLAISQYQDLPPEIATRQKVQAGLAEARLECMFQLLGRWHVSRDFSHNLRHLLTPQEIKTVCETLQVQYTD